MTRSFETWLERINPQVHLVWRGSWPAGTVEPERILVDHELVIFCKGVCTVELSGRGFRCEAPAFLVVPPGISHATYGGDAPILRACVHFDWTWTGKSLPERLWGFPSEPPRPKDIRRAPAFVPRGVLHGHIERPEAVYELAEALEFRWRTGGAACRALLLELLILLLAPRRQEPHPFRGPREELALRAKAALDSMRPDRDSITDVLGSLGASYEHVCRCFKRRFGMSPVRYLTCSRLERAKRLLRQPDAKVSWVASASGYPDAGYFSRIFRKYVGVSPSEYAASARRL